MRKIKWLNAFLFILPALLIYLTFFLYPAIDTFRLSFYDLTGMGLNKQFIGLANFRQAIIHDAVFWDSVRSTLVIVVVGGILVFGGALFYSMIFSRYRVKGKGFFKTLVILPIAISHIAIGIGWTFIYNGRWGLLNNILRSIGLEELAKPWLGFPEYALPAIIVVVFWMQIGFYTLLLLAGLESIPTVYEEAAIVDGASNWTIFTKILFPLLKGVFTTSALYWIMNMLKIFAIIWVLTGAGLSSTLFTLSTYTYRMAFGQQVASYRFGYASAIAVLLFLFSIVFSIFYLRLISKKEVHQY